MDIYIYIYIYIYIKCKKRNYKLGKYLTND